MTRATSKQFQRLLFTQPVASCIVKWLACSVTGAITLIAWLDDDETAKQAITAIIPTDRTLSEHLQKFALLTAHLRLGVRVKVSCDAMQVLFLAIGMRRSGTLLSNMHHIVDFSSWPTKNLPLTPFYAWLDVQHVHNDTKPSTMTIALLDTIIRQHLRSMDAELLAHETLHVETELMLPTKTPYAVRHFLTIPVTKIFLHERFRGQDGKIHDLAVALARQWHAAGHKSTLIRHIVREYLLPCVEMPLAMHEQIRLDVEKIINPNGDDDGLFVVVNTDWGNLYF